MNPSLPRRGMLEDAWFERTERIPMTKAPVRAIALSLLSPLRGFDLLEIGSGTGAMTVELLRAAGEDGRVTSLEILPEAASLAARNVERSGLASRARLIVGGAPENIPQGEFDAIFIGGHGGALERIIQICWERLRPEGRLLVTAITPSTTSRTLACLGDINAKTGFWRTHTSAGHRAGAEWLLAGNNPIDFIWGDR